MNYLKVSNLLRKWSFKLKSMSIYFELKHYIVHQEYYIKKIHYWERNIGKTYNLVKLARKFDLPIIVADRSSESYIRSIEKECFRKTKNEIKVIIANIDSKGKRWDIGLVDEGINEKCLNWRISPMFKCLVGYKSDY